MELFDNDLFDKTKIVEVEGKNYTGAVCASENYIYATTHVTPDNFHNLVQIDIENGTKVKEWEMGKVKYPAINLYWISHLKMLILQTKYNISYSTFNEEESARNGFLSILSQPTGMQYKYHPVTPMAILRGGETDFSENDSWKMYGRDLSRISATKLI